MEHPHMLEKDENELVDRMHEKKEGATDAETGININHVSDCTAFVA